MMITVTIAINDQVIFARSARNNTEKNKKGETKYITDANRVIWHKREDGAIKLCKKILDTINEGM